MYESLSELKMHTYATLCEVHDSATLAPVVRDGGLVRDKFCPQDVGENEDMFAKRDLEESRPVNPAGIL